MTVMAFVLAAGLGTAIRWRTGMLLPRPVGTLLVNVAGAFLLGWVSAVGPDHEMVLGVAGLGALTTFSTLIAEIVDIAEQRRGQAFSYAALTVVAGVAAAAFGLSLG
jgi:CrcB protein